MAFSDADRSAIADAIARAELATSGEIVCVVNEHPHRYLATALSVAALAAFAVPFAAVAAGVDLAALMPWRTWSGSGLSADIAAAIEAYAVVQVAVFAAALLLLLWATGLVAWLTPRGVKRDRVHAEALSQFRARGLGRTRARTGVLIYVSTPDRIAEVVADEGIYAKVEPAHWAQTVAALVAGIKAGDAVRGFVDAVTLAGAVLAAHFPPAPDDNPNELPDRLIEL